MRWSLVASLILAGCADDSVGGDPQPDVDVTPETLSFGDLAVGEALTLTFDLEAGGDAPLAVYAIAFADPEAVAGTFVLTTGGEPLPGADELPLLFQPGDSQPFEVTYAPTSGTSWDEELHITTNDPDEPTAVVRLLAGAEYSGEPTVEITSPSPGSSLASGAALTLTASILDDADDPTSLLGFWQFFDADTGASLGVETSYGDADGEHAITITGGLPAGDVTIRLGTTDSSGNSASDEIDVEILEGEGPVLYTLSGGEQLSDSWSVDEDVTIYLNETSIFSDNNQGSDTHSPLEFEAEEGDVLRIVARNGHSCDLYLNTLVLHLGTDAQQALNDELCISPCAEHACYDASYTQASDTFFDEEFEIAIP